MMRNDFIRNSIKNSCDTLLLSVLITSMSKYPEVIIMCKYLK